MLADQTGRLARQRSRADSTVDADRLGEGCPGRIATAKPILKLGNRSWPITSSPWVQQCRVQRRSTARVYLTEAGWHRKSGEVCHFTRSRACIRGEQTQCALVLVSQRFCYVKGVSLLDNDGLSSVGLAAVPRPPADIAVANIMSAHAPTTNDAFVKTPDI